MQTTHLRTAVALLIVGSWMPAWAGEAEPPLDAQQRIEAAEYEVTWHQGYQAPNRAQGFRTYFSETGIRAVPRVPIEDTWEWGLQWIGYGSGSGAQSAPGAIPKAVLAARGNRIDLERGAFTEWYENRPQGLKQGFLLPVPPDDDAPGGRVHVDLALTGTLAPVISEDGQSIDFVTAEGVRVLRYTELRVTDARGEAVPARMEGFADARARGIRLVLDAKDALYPLTIDPVTVTPVWTNESNQATAEFGKSVGTAGDVNGDGYSDLIVGAPFYDNGQADEGRAYLYLGSASGLASSPAWFVESDQAGARFGWVVGTAGDVNGDGFSDVIVGAPLYDNGQTDEGKAWVYHGSTSGLSTTANWFQESNQAGAQFGVSVAIAGDIDGTGYADVLVGAWLYSNGQNAEGRVYVYMGFSTGLAFFALTTLENDQADSELGFSVAPAGDVNGDGFADVLVTAPFYFVSPTVGGGQARVYLGTGAGLSPGYTWSHLRPQANAAYGWSAATAGDVNGDGYADIAVGAPWEDNGQTNEGLVFVYTGSQTFISNGIAWTESNQVSAQLGTSVATAGDVNGDGYADMVIGAPFYDGGSGVDQGKVFLYIGSATGLIATLWAPTEEQALAQFGAAVGSAGDVNGDGYDDVIVGAPLWDDFVNDDGKAFVYLGSASGLATTAAWSTRGGITGVGYGAAVGTAGDVNGDGYADVIVGAPQDSNGQSQEGRASVFLGSASGLSTTAAWTGEANQAGARYGYAVGTAGDVNGDGYADVVVGAPYFDTGATDGGRAFVYLGSSSGLALAHAWSAQGIDFNARFGSAVSTSGDTNGDGYADVMVGAPFAPVPYVAFYLGYNLGVLATPSFTALSDSTTQTQSQTQFGLAVATAGDINGDGFADVAVGAPQFDKDHSENLYGWAFVYYGSASGITSTFGSSAGGGQANDRFGTSAAAAGDVNGDGYGEVVFGVPRYDNGQVDEGRAFVHFGGGTPGVALNPRQKTTDGARPISRMGLSDAGSAFQLAARGRTPFGRGKVRLEWEVKPFGTIFNGTGTGIGVASVDTGLSGADVTQVVPNLVPGTRYHWRLRLVYDQASVPFAKKSRWVTMPWAGWQQAMLRTGSAPAGRAGSFAIAKVGLGVTMSWSASSSCLESDFDYAIYEGALGSFTSHVPVTCATFPAHSWNFTPGAGNRYFLLVPVNTTQEGSYGLRSNGAERPASASACKPQLVAACP